MHLDAKKHWEDVYANTDDEAMSWSEPLPATSLRLIEQLNLPASASIIDVGAGNSKLAGHLLNKGYHNVTVLDISAQALKKSRDRLGDVADKVIWIRKDITRFVPTTNYVLWHDRATFHFLTSDDDIAYYREITARAVTGYMVIGTFSDKGPDKCSGLEIKKYKEDELAAVFADAFEKIDSLTEDHITPWGSCQNFLFCTFRRRI